MNIEVGKFYKTRNGLKARIYALDGNDFIHGAVQVDSQWLLFAWQKDGRYIADRESGWDLIAPLIDKPEFDRSLLPAWANKAIAMDKNGYWYCYGGIPVIEKDLWNNPNAMKTTEIHRPFLPKWSGDWKDSLLVFED